MGIQDRVYCWYLAGRSLDWVEYLPGSSIEGLIEQEVQELMKWGLHSHGNSGKGSSPVILTFVNEVPHHLLECPDSSFNMAVDLVVVSGSHPY